MNTPIEESPQNGKQRRKSIGTPGSLSSGNGGLDVAGGKTRRYSIGIASSQKSIEGNIVPNYLRASTGSCHDFCKYGKKHEQSKSAIPNTFKRTTIVNKEKVSKTIVPLKTRHVKPSPVVVNSSSAIINSSESAVTNGRIKKTDIRTVKKMGMAPTVAALKKVVTKTTPTESQSLKASFSRAASLKAIKHKNLKQVSPLKDQNRMQKNELKKQITEAKPHTMEFESICPTIDIIQSPQLSSMELINALDFKSLQFSSDKNVLDEELTVTHPVYESSELFPEKELLEESSIAPPGCESFQSSSDKELLEGSSIQPRVSERSESSYEEEVLEEEFEYTDDEEVSDEEYESTDNEEVFATANNDRMETLGDQSKIPRKVRVVISEEKDEEGVKLRFRRGKILDLQSENNGPRRLKFRRRVIEGNEDGQSIARKTYKNKILDLHPEINGPRRLIFRKGKVMEDHEDKHIARRTFEKKYIEEKDDSNLGPESVVLKHQGEQGKKDAQGLFNNVIEETASKLVESRKSKVKALVGAFETVISLQDAKPSST